MLVKNFVHDPADVLDYYIDWTSFLAGDTIVTSTWTALSGTVTLSLEGIVGSFTRVWVAGGVAGEIVELLNHIVTAEGREKDGSLELILRD